MVDTNFVFAGGGKYFRLAFGYNQNIIPSVFGIKSYFRVLIKGVFAQNGVVLLNANVFSVLAGSNPPTEYPRAYHKRYDY